MIRNRERSVTRPGKMRAAGRVSRSIGAAALVAMLGIAVPATAGPSEPQDATGHWTVFYGAPDPRGNVTSATGGKFTIEVVSQDHRRLSGVITGFGDSAPIPMQGTISDSGHLSLQAHGVDQSHLVIKGETSYQTHTPGAKSVGELVLTGAMTDKRGPLVGGTQHELVAVQQPAEASLTRVEGTYEGEIRALDGGSRTTMTATFTQTRTAGLVAEVSIGDERFEAAVSLFDYFNEEKQELETAFASAGGGESGLILIQGTVGPDWIDVLVHVIPPGTTERTEGSTAKVGRIDFKT
jgi:hypothetical protein